ncbi:MAG: EpsI family protein [Azoarcus sp.]|jgi:EpsI family protein|nr:EpsI family protein [Azoarcus sp.]
MPSITFRALLIALAMLFASILAHVLTPSAGVQVVEFDIEAIIPQKFADWQMEERNAAGVINPQTQTILDQIYSKLLSRTYVNTEGRRIMLSLAYGADQSHDKQIHKPEVCYPAQGFQIASKRKDMLQAGTVSFPVMRVVAQLGKRHEPVTYWIRLGDVLVRGLVEQTLVRIRYGLSGHIPDGILFRVSEINPDAHDSYALQDKFINELLPALSPESRKILLGSKVMN